jgi:hypothetical protein
MEYVSPGILWALVIVGGPILLGLAMYFYGDRLPPLTRRQREAGDRAARESWGKEKVH